MLPIPLNPPLSLRLFCFGGSAIKGFIALAYRRSSAKGDFLREIDLRDSHCFLKHPNDLKVPNDLNDFKDFKDPTPENLP